MNELRENPVTGARVVVAPVRTGRPRQVGADAFAAAAGPVRDPGCPFCPGNEDDLPGILWEDSSSGDPGWRVRAVPNKYPAFLPPERGAEGRGPGLPAVGRQEVVIETPRHDLDPYEMSDEDLRLTLHAYHARALALASDEAVRRVVPFRNRGARAGASLAHAHGQIIATATVPPAVEIREGLLRAHHEERGSCLLCRLPEAEPDGSQRVVFDEGGVLAYVPWAAEAQYEVWLIPRNHRAGFLDAPAGEREAVADALGRVLRKLRTLAGDADYNWMLHTAGSAHGGDPALHWFLQLRPRLAQPAGFELATGMSINPSSPEGDAEALRDAAEAGRPGST